MTHTISLKEFFLFIKHNPFLAYLYTYIFFLPWDLWKPQMGVFSSILLVFWLIIGRKKGYFTRLPLIFKSLPINILFMFFLYILLSLLWTSNIDMAFYTNIRFYKYYLILIPILYTVLTPKEAKVTLYILIASLTLYAFFSLSIYLELFKVYDSTKANPKGIMAYAIVTPYMAIATLSLSVISIYINNYKWKLLLYFFILITFIALFINNGRAGQLAFFATIISLLIVNLKFLNKKIIFLSLSSILLSLMLLNHFNKLDRLTHAFSELTHVQETHFGGSWGQRLYLWYAAFDIIEKNPIIGVGAGDNIDELKKFGQTHPSKATGLGTFHNQHLDYLTRFGIIGYLLFWGSIIVLLYQLKENFPFYNLAIVFFGITFFDGIGDIILLIKPYNNFFIVFFILFSIIVQNNEQRHKGIL